jgi:ubiquinone/menaquinone biosynthesis C-methylase UbiE
LVEQGNFTGLPYPAELPKWGLPSCTVTVQTAPQNNKLRKTSMNATTADIYEIAMGRWSRRLSRNFLDFVAAPSCGSLIDVGCGTGSLTLAAATRYPKARIVGVDLIPDYLSEALLSAAPNVSFETGDASNLPFGDDSFDTAFSQLLLNDLEGPAGAVSEMVRVTKPGGRIILHPPVSRCRGRDRLSGRR